jgi:hypothetical protein
MVGGVARQGSPLLTLEEGAAWIREQVASGMSFAVGKLGTSELDAILFWLVARRNKQQPQKYLPHIFQHITLNAGIFPANDAAIDDWCEEMVARVLPALDGIAEWNPSAPVQENQLLNATAPTSRRFPLRSIEPYYVRPDDRWSLAAPRTIAVISPFARSIAHQWTHIGSVWNTERVWSEEKPALHTIRAGYSPSLAPRADASWSPAVIAGGWRAAVASVVDAVVASGARLALIGCGALSLPIAAGLKARGVAAIHTGGATQILFGVQGRRWMTHSVISRFFNEAWTTPRPDEIPAGAGACEGACYW